MPRRKPPARQGVRFAVNTSMARIRAVQRHAITVVTVSGSLRARDMRRLEHACSPALTMAQLQLTVDLTRVTHVDRAAEALLKRMATRGALIKTRAHFLPSSH